MSLLIIHRQGERIHVPVCARCKHPILDFEAANLVEIGEAGIAEPFHRECDRSQGLWTPLSCVFRTDQRRH